MRKTLELLAVALVVTVVVVSAIGCICTCVESHDVKGALDADAGEDDAG
jgi:hypothetical protein